MGLPTLISPAGSDFIKDWPGQNTINCDRLDAFANQSALGNALPFFVPTLKGSVTDPVLGTGGVNRAYFYRIFDEIYIWGEWRWGTSGTNFGSGIYTLTLPFTVDTQFTPNAALGSTPIVGSGFTWDQSGNSGRQSISVHLINNNQLMFAVRLNSGLSNREVRDVFSVAWANQDGVSYTARLKVL